LIILQFEVPGTNLVLKCTHKIPNESSLSISTFAIAVAINVYAYQDPESPIPNVIERGTSSSANDIVGTQRCNRSFIQLLFLIIFIV
jgi:hypothetical protein